MTATHGDAEILKTDGVGRVRTPTARREQLLDEFDRSGLSGPKFAALVGVKYPTLAGWVQKRRQTRSPSGPPTSPRRGAIHWLEALVDDSKAPTRGDGHLLVVELPGGARLRLGHPDQAELAVAILRALAKPC